MQQLTDTKPIVPQLQSYPQQQQVHQQQQQQQQHNTQHSGHAQQQPPLQSQQAPGPPPPLPMLQAAAAAEQLVNALQQQHQQQQLMQQQMAHSQPMQQQAQQLFAQQMRMQMAPKAHAQPKAKAAAQPSKRGKGRKKQAPQAEGYYPQYLAERHFPSSKDPLKITVLVELDGKKQDESYPATLTIKHCFDQYYSYFLDLPKELRARIRKAEIKGWEQVDELTICISLSSLKSSDATPAASSLGGNHISPSALTSTSAAAQAAALSWPPTSAAPPPARSSHSSLTHPAKSPPAAGSPTSIPAARASPTDPYNRTALDPSSSKSAFPLSPHLQATAAAAALANPTSDALSNLLLAQQFASDPTNPAAAAHLDLLLKNPHLASHPAAAAAAANLKATMAAAAASGFPLGPFHSPSSFAPSDLDPSAAASSAAAAAALNPLLFQQFLQGLGAPADPSQPLPRHPTDTTPSYDHEQNTKRIRYSEALTINTNPDPTQPTSLLNAVPSASGATTPNTLAMRSLTGGPPLHLQHPPLPDDDTLDGASWDRYMTAMLDGPVDKLWPPVDPSTSSFDPALMHSLPMADFMQSDPSCPPPLASPRLPDIAPLQTGLSHLPFAAPSPTTRQLDIAAAAQAKDLTAALNASHSPMLSSLHKTAHHQHSPQQSQQSPTSTGNGGGAAAGGGLCDASTMVAELLHMVGYLKPSFEDRLLLLVALQKAGMQQLAAVHLAMKGAWDKKSILRAHEIFDQVMEANQVQQLRMDGVTITAPQVAGLSFPVILPGHQGAANLSEGLSEVLNFCQASAQLQAEVLLAVQHANDLRRQVINTGLVDACVRRNLDDLKGVVYSIINV